MKYSELVNELIKDLLPEEKNKKIVAAYGGGFKPPTKGHFEVVTTALNTFPEIDEFIIYVGGGERGDINQAQSILIWEIYQTYLPMKVRIEPAKAPIGDIVRLGKNNLQDEIYFIVGAREGFEGDVKDIESRTKNIEEKYPNMKVKVITTIDKGISGTNARKASQVSYDDFTKYIPSELSDNEKEEVYNIVKPSISETNKPEDGKAAPYGSGYNKLNEDITKPQLDALETYADKLFAKLGIDVEFTRHFLDRANDERNIKPISIPELMGMFKRLHKKHGKPLSKVDNDFDAVVKDFNSNINIPFAINVTPNDIDLVAKTVMRKKDFKTSTPVIALNENATYTKKINLINRLATLTQHMLDKGMNIEPLPKLEFIDGDVENASEFLGKTAYYDPNTQTIVLYTEGRHPKDITRSYAHEMIHHIQNLEGRLGNITTTNTQEDDNLNDIEAEANLKGTMTFRNWTDSLNENVLPQEKFAQETNRDYIEQALKILPNKDKYNLKDYSVEILPIDKVKPTQFGEDYINASSEYEAEQYQKYIDGEISAEDLRREDFYPIVVDKDTMEILDGNHRHAVHTMLSIPKIKAILVSKKLNEIQTPANEKDVDPKELKMGIEVEMEHTDDKAKAKIIALQHLAEDPKYYTKLKSLDLEEAIVGEKIECDGCGWSWNIVDGGDDLFICHKCGHDNTPLNEAKPYKHKHGFNDKLGKDPFGLNQFAREIAEEVISEGRYDRSTNQFSKIAFEAFKDIHDRGDKEGTFEFSVGPFEEDIYSDQFEFDFEGYVEITDNEYNVNGGANQGFDKKGDEITPLLNLNFKIPKNPTTNPSWEDISFDIKDVVRHELEHLTQGGLNLKGGAWDEDPKLRRPSKQMADDQLIRDLIDADMLPKSQYYKLEKEVDAMLQGLYFKAKKSKRPFKNVINDYLDIFVKQKTISQKDKENILDIWRSRRVSLSLPIFENRTQDMDYEIYSDMDGVLTDFDAHFMKASDGMLPSEYQKIHGVNGFWNLIDEGGEAYWVEMPWMPDGKTYWDYIKDYNPILLSSPSRSSSSRVGKRVWVKNNLPGTKLILSQSKDKQNYAQKNRILIDDRPSNIEQWRLQGGIGILHTSAADTIQQLKKLNI